MPESQSLDDGGLLLPKTDCALHELHCHAFGFSLLLSRFLRHDLYSVDAMRSAMSLPRSRATVTGSFSARRPLNVARTTLCGLAEPRDLVSTFCSPADSTTARTAPPAMM